MIAIYYLLTRLPRPFRVLVAVMLAGLLIESFAHVLSVISNQEKQLHVHTHRNYR